MSITCVFASSIHWTVICWGVCHEVSLQSAAVYTFASMASGLSAHAGMSSHLSHEALLSSLILRGVTAHNHDLWYMQPGHDMHDHDHSHSKFVLYKASEHAHYMSVLTHDIPEVVTRQGRVTHKGRPHGLLPAHPALPPLTPLASPLYTRRGCRMNIV